MDIVKRKITDLKPYKLNARLHPETQIKGISESISRFGFIQPIVVDKHDEIIIGHGRLSAAKLLGLKDVPTVKLSDLTPQEVKALRLIDNRISETGWDIDLLKCDLEDLEIDMEPFAVDFSGMLGEEEPEATEDDFEAPPIDEIVTDIKLGDVIELGRHRLMCGDSRESEPKSWKFTNMVTDPPYGVGFNYESHDDTKENLFDLIERSVVQRLSYIKQSILTTGQTNLFHYPKPDWIFAWINEAGTGSGPFGFTCWQPVIVYGKDPYLARGEGSRPDIFKGNIAADKEIKKRHTCPKPLPVWIDIIKRLTIEGDIFDPFLGSGTTLIACEQLNRTCYGMEIDPKYCQVIVDRYQKHCKDSNKKFECKINGENYEPTSKL